MGKVHKYYYYDDPVKRELHKKRVKEYNITYRKRKDVQKRIKEHRREYFKRPEVIARIKAMRKKKN